MTREAPEVMSRRDEVFAGRKLSFEVGKVAATLDMRFHPAFKSRLELVKELLALDVEQI